MVEERKDQRRLTSAATDPPRKMLANMPLFDIIAGKPEEKTHSM
jgi:hypothetical protein